VHYGGQSNNPCTSTVPDLLCNPVLSMQQPHNLKCSTSLTQTSAKSPGFKECRPRCPTLNTANASQSQRTCEAVSNSCLHLSHPGLSISPSLNSCPFKRQCPLTSPVIILSCFLLKLSNSPTLLAEGLLRKSLACLCP
jgi:hypothetical protein